MTATLNSRAASSKWDYGLWWGIRNVRATPRSGAALRLVLKLAGKPNSVPRRGAVAVISLGRRLPAASSSLPGGHKGRAAPRRSRAPSPLLGLAPGGVCRAAVSPQRWCALTTPFHPYRCRRCVFCGTFRRVTPPGRYPAPCSMESGLSSGGAQPPATARPAWAARPS